MYQLRLSFFWTMPAVSESQVMDESLSYPPPGVGGDVHASPTICKIGGLESTVRLRRRSAILLAESPNRLAPGYYRNEKNFGL